jgi:phospholipid transport system substrate-binding protein
MSVFISRRSFAAGAVAGALMVAIRGQRAGAADDPAQAFIQGLGDRAIGVLKDKADSSFAEREAAFREVMVAGFDIPTVSRFVLGRHWKTASEQQRADYKAIFVDFIVRVYASRFDSYGGEQFTVRSVIDDESGDKIVRGQIVRPSGGDPIDVDFRVRSRDGSYKVIDVGVEGISMLHTHRVEFGSVVNRKGIDGLLSDLRARIEAPVENKAD